MPTAPEPSASLVRAVQAEDSRLTRALEVLDQRRGALQAELSSLNEERRELQARRNLLAQVAGLQVASDSAGGVVAHTQLKGRELRRVAGQLLWQLQRDREIHYRDWFEHVLAAGYAVAGKDPAASFLTNIRDSPAVSRGSSSGHYRIDPEALARTRQARAEALAELDDLETRIAVSTRDALAEPPRPGELEELREHRQGLKAQLRRLELEADEVAAIVATDERDSSVKPRLVA